MKKIIIVFILAFSTINMLAMDSFRTSQSGDCQQTEQAIPRAPKTIQVRAVEFHGTPPAPVIPQPSEQSDTSDNPFDPCEFGVGFACPYSNLDRLEATLSRKRFPSQTIEPVALEEKAPTMAPLPSAADEELHTKGKRMEYKCPRCGFIVNTGRKHALYHKSLHDNPDAFRCGYPGCLFLAVVDTALGYHIAIKHPNFPPNIPRKIRLSQPQPADTITQTYSVCPACAAKKGIPPTAVTAQSLEKNPKLFACTICGKIPMMPYSWLEQRTCHSCGHIIVSPHELQRHRANCKNP